MVRKYLAIILLCAIAIISQSFSSVAELGPAMPETYNRYPIITYVAGNETAPAMPETWDRSPIATDDVENGSVEEVPYEAKEAMPESWARNPIPGLSPTEVVVIVLGSMYIIKSRRRKE